MNGKNEEYSSLFNLIVYTHEARYTEYFSKIVKLISTQFPCRIIFIKVHLQSKESFLKVTKTTENSKNEQIFIDVSEGDISKVYFLLLPLFIPDLPIYLLWGQDPTTENTLLPHLENFASRLIFDAETTENLQRFSQSMLARMESYQTQIVDMNWARISGWREVLAQIYDSPERFEQLVTAHSIELHYNDKANDLLVHPETQAIYLQAWLASRLKWKFVRGEKENGTQILYYQSLNKLRKFKLIPSTNSAFESEEVLSMEVSGENGYECHIQHMTPSQVKVQASNQFQCELPFLLYMPTLQSARSFMQEIFFQKTSSQYKQLLEMIQLVKWS